MRLGLLAVVAVIAWPTLPSCGCPDRRAGRISLPASEAANADPSGSDQLPGETAPAAPGGPAVHRVPLVANTHPLYARVEGTSLANDCQNDDNCHIGGCSSEICSAEQGASSTCEVQAWPTIGGSCGCVANQCQWYRVVETPTGQTGPSAEPARPHPDRVPGNPAADEPAPAAAQGRPCGADGSCGPGLTCVTYYGIAGARGPQFRTCERRCATDKDCPAGQRCATVADGPGQVCRP
jgi:eight-cysteine-cluster-containing protein